MKKRRKWLPIAIVAVVVVLGIGGFVMMTHNSESALSVSQLKSRVASLDGQSVLLEGEVMPGSVQWDRASQTMRFDIGDGAVKQPVIYIGVVPDRFRVGTKVTVEGQVLNGYFQAQRFISRPSVCNVCHE